MQNYLNINIPFFWGYIDEAFFYDEAPNVNNKRVLAEFFMYTSIPSRCGMFTAMTEWGTQHARIPINYIYTCEKGGLDVPIDFLQLWDSFSYYCSCLEIDYLKNKSVEIITKDKIIIEGQYMFTLDWCNGGYSEMAAGHKTGHVIKSKGRIFIQPNNRIIKWNDGGAFTSGRLKEKPKWKVFSQEFSCEQSSSKWTSESQEELYWYDFKKE